MGVHIVGKLERKDASGEWVELGESDKFFDFQNYGTYGWLAGVRNYSAVPTLEALGTSEWDEDDESYIYTLPANVLLEFDYEQMVEDRRGPSWSTVPAGEGITQTFREFLGEGYFERLELLRKSGAERLVFYFS